MTAPVSAPSADAGFVDSRPAHGRRPGQASDRRRTRSFPPLRGLLPLGLLLGLWQLLGSAASPYFPPPSTWIGGLQRLWENGSLRPAAGETLVTFALSLVAATVLGSLLGIVVGASKKVDRALGPTLEFARAMPPAAMVPIAALLIGYGETMKVAVVTFAAVWPVLLNARAGVRALDPVLVDAARSLHLNWFDTVRKCIAPALAPAVLLGVRVAAPMALVITLLVEIVTRVGGLGGLIALGQRNYLSAQVYGTILVAGLFSFLVNGVVAALEGAAFRHRPR
ncbi:MAG TPA: ABC transporter permease subunit [Acidimicrobiales bacterium]|nr:ABC transporter permease subunit [Acidimicrobiales bacterium]